MGYDPTIISKDPQPSVDRIEELAREILKGKIRLPKFQRSFVWDKDQILTLLDSIGRGFPIGSVLLWESSNELSSENRLADLEIAIAPPRYPVKYVLDGQQRLSAICGSLFWKGGDANSRWNIAYDLRARKFFHLDSCDDPPLHQVPVSRLSDAAAFFRHVASLETLSTSDKNVLKANADLLFNRFKDYKIATVTLADMSVEDVAPIFERINSTGTTLTIVDLMRAATWSLDFDLVTAIDGILESLDERGFSDIDRKVILRNISVAAGGTFTVDSIDSLRNHDAERLNRAVQETRSAYERAIDFLISSIGVPNAAILPYTNQLVVLAELFRILPFPADAQLELIRAWFWQTSATGHFGGWNTGMMRNDLEATRAFAEGRALELTVSSQLPPDSIWSTTQFRTNTARTKLFAIILAKQRPRDLLTGEVIDTEKILAWVNVREFRNFFSVPYLRLQGTELRVANALANMVLMSASTSKRIINYTPSELATEISHVAGGDLENRLAGNLIPLDAFHAAMANDYPSFLRRRAVHLNEVVRRYFSDTK